MPIARQSLMVPNPGLPSVRAGNSPSLWLYDSFVTSAKPIRLKSRLRALSSSLFKPVVPFENETLARFEFREVDGSEIYRLRGISILSILFNVEDI